MAKRKSIKSKSSGAKPKAKAARPKAKAARPKAKAVKPKAKAAKPASPPGAPRAKAKAIKPASPSGAPRAKAAKAKPKAKPRESSSSKSKAKAAKAKAAKPKAKRVRLPRLVEHEPYKGFKAIDPGIRETVAEAILQAIKESAHRFPSDSTFSGVVNRDSSVDVEIKVPLHRGQDVRRRLIDVEGYTIPVLPRVKFGRVWLSVALRFPPSHAEGVKEDIRYDRVRGQWQVGTFWRDSTKKAYSYVMLRRKLLVSLQKNRRRKATFIIVKYHWNPWNLKPTRL